LLLLRLLVLLFASFNDQQSYGGYVIAMLSPIDKGHFSELRLQQQKEEEVLRRFRRLLLLHR
jgi:hypothetical protein